MKCFIDPIISAEAENDGKKKLEKLVDLYSNYTVYSITS